MTELTTSTAAKLLGVNQSRVRALAAAGTLKARRVGPMWLVDEESVDRQREFILAGATGRSMSARVAWAAADLADGGGAAWLPGSERSRLKRRVKAVTSIDDVRRWLSRRARETSWYRVGEQDLRLVLAADGVVRTGVSAASAYGVGLGAGGSADVYVSADVAKALVEEFYLIEAVTGNLCLRVADSDLHCAASRVASDGGRLAPRLIVGVDLADDRDARTRSAGRALLRTVMEEQERH